MSVAVSSAVWKQSKAKGSARLVLLAIADFAHDDGGGAYPSIATLASMTKLSERTVQRLVQQLEAAGELAVERGTGRGNPSVYRVRMGDTTTSPFADEERVTNDAERVTSETQRVTNPAERVTHMSPQPLVTVKEPSPPLPPPPQPMNGGMKVSYATVLNGKMPDVSAAFRKLSPELTDGWLQGCLASASQESPRPLSEKDILAKLGAARAAIERQLSVERQNVTAWRPNNLPAWARSRVVNALKE